MRTVAKSVFASENLFSGIKMTAELSKKKKKMENMSFFTPLIAIDAGNRRNNIMCLEMGDNMFSHFYESRIRMTFVECSTKAG